VSHHALRAMGTEMVPATERKARPRQKPLPAPDRDFYELAGTVKVEEFLIVKQVRGVVVATLALGGIQG
jgi:hypothetical protein